MNALLAIGALSAGNFIYQMFFVADPNWIVAFERSFFQAMAILLYVLFWGKK